MQVIMTADVKPMIFSQCLFKKALVFRYYFFYSTCICRKLFYRFLCEYLFVVFVGALGLFLSRYAGLCFWFCFFGFLQLFRSNCRCLLWLGVSYRIFSHNSVIDLFIVDNPRTDHILNRCGSYSYDIALLKIGIARGHEV